STSANSSRNSSFRSASTPRRGWLATVAGLVLAAVLPVTAAAQMSLRSSDDIPGDIALVGNTLMTHCEGTPVVCGSLSYTNNNTQMQYVNTAAVPSATYANSSTADLNLPAGSTVLHAFMYWGGRAGSTDSGRGSISLKLPGGSYQTITASTVNTFTSQGDTNADRPYDAFADITSIVTGAGAGSGTYSVGNADILVGDTSSGLGYYGGWAIGVVYSNPSKPYRRLAVYDATSIVVSGTASQSATVTGLLTPTSGAFNAYLGALVWEGDCSISGDAFQLLDPASGNVVNPGNLSDALSPNPGCKDGTTKQNFWNGGITYLGADVTTRNPDYPNNLAIDLKIVDISNTGSGTKPQLANNATQATLQFTTNGDVYFPQVATFVTDERPALQLTKTITAGSPYSAVGNTISYS
ncbi:MAG: hypothetical protein JSR84_10135, partial [Proteobacteria bacterium]|nr:hypothetical protein [Pseudomonadota bacterium]